MKPQKRKSWGLGMFGSLLLSQEIVLCRGTKSQNGNSLVPTGKGHLTVHQLFLPAPDVGFSFIQ